MALTIDYCELWKWLKIDWSTFYTFYGKDFNPNVPTLPNWDTFEADDITNSFNLLWFQPWHEVGCSVVNFTDIDISWAYLFFYFYQWNQTSYPSWVNDFWYQSFGSYNTYAYYAYFWIDDDEIWNGYSTYKYTWVITTDRYDASSSARLAEYTGSFSVSNLSFDDSLHPSWYLWVEWNYLCYTDAVHGSRWYKHKINYDTGYSWWSGDAWHIWVGSWTAWRIYYTDAYWDVRRTHLADSWYGWRRYGSSWYIYVSDGDYTEWYWYLCFVDGNGELRRIWNWVP